MVVGWTLNVLAISLTALSSIDHLLLIEQVQYESPDKRLPYLDSPAQCFTLPMSENYSFWTPKFIT